MAKFLEKFKENSKKFGDKFEEIKENKEKTTFEKNRVPKFDKKDYSIEDDYESDEDFNELDELDDYNERYDDMTIQPSQKPESFHHFILENQYKDLERSIRGFKDVFDKETQQWKTIRKKQHCFTDEEAESILRAAQSHLATDIKLSRFKEEAFLNMMDLLFEHFQKLFRRMAEYRYGRYNSFDKNGKLIKVNYDLQGIMKDENKKILVELYNRIWANYSRAVGGMENKYTHDSVKGQESLQQTDRDMNYGKRYS